MGNIIQDIDRNYVNPHGDSGVNVVYNNLFYNTVKPLKNNTVGLAKAERLARQRGRSEPRRSRGFPTTRN